METQRIFNNLPKLETERLLLRKLRYKDVQDIYDYAQDEEVAQFVMWDAHHSELETLEFLNVVIGLYNKNEPAPWGIELKETRRIIGTIGFVTLESEHNKAEVGYTLSKRYWNQGLMTEALTKIMEFGFEKMRLNRIEARCIAENLQSIKVLQKVGMIEEGTLRQFLYMKKKFRDIKIFSILKSDYFFSKEKESG